jgi:hypothetical protein
MDTMTLNNNNVLTDEEMLQAIHECVYGSTIRHILKLPSKVLIEYLSKYPFYRGADTLYYYLLKREGNGAHYGPDGRHLLLIHPELIGVYVLAEQNIKAPKSQNQNNQTNQTNQINNIDDTIYPMIKANIDRTITCDRYQLRHSLIIGEAPFDSAIKIPSIALNNPIYQRMFQQLINSPRIIMMLIENDCWEPIKSLNSNIFTFILSRMSTSKGNFPNLWKLVLKDYYSKQLLRLKIHDLLPDLVTRQLTILNSLIPNLIQFPTDLDTLGIRLWFSSRAARAYLVGYDVSDGIPADNIISERLHHMQDIGIEHYINEITGVYIDESGNLTGQIGMMIYPDLIGKKLMNYKDTRGNSIGIYYPFDLFHIIVGNNAYIVPLTDITFNINNGTLDLNNLRNILVSQYIPYLTESPSETQLKELFKKLCIPLGINRGIPARNRLVEIMSYDLLNY